MAIAGYFVNEISTYTSLVRSLFDLIFERNKNNILCLGIFLLNLILKTVIDQMCVHIAIFINDFNIFSIMALNEK